jgi:alpha,alpha-trehalose phosphorylase
VHIASLAGSWIALVAGLGGMRDHDGRLSFAPRLPSKIDRLEFSVHWRGLRLRVTVHATEATYTVRDSGGAAIELTHHGEPLRVRAGHPVTRPIPPAPVITARPVQPPGRTPMRQF